MSRLKILNKQQIEQKLTRIAWQIYESNYKESLIVLAGISGNGFIIAKRLVPIIEKISKLKVLLSEIKINKKEPFSSAIHLSIIEEEYTDRVIVMVDDVVNSGKTMIYGVKHFLNAPVKKITTTALINRKHLRFPIRTDFAGIVLSTSIKDHVAVELGDDDGVYIE
tara:strand:- start:45 stop:542 length:498 start_codon:yes stop_codon:yes gene_type:complete